GLRLRCPSCGRKLKLPSAQQGKRMRCPSCQQPFTAASDSATVPSPSPLPPKPAPARPPSALVLGGLAGVTLLGLLIGGCLLLNRGDRNRLAETFRQDPPQPLPPRYAAAKDFGEKPAKSEKKDGPAEKQDAPPKVQPNNPRPPA